jgi:hypothetical protein
MMTRIGRFLATGLGCGLLGAIIGAVFGGLAGLPFFLPVGAFYGLFMGAIGGFAAGFIGASYGGPPGFRIGGIAGAVVSMAVFPFAIAIVIPPVLALAVGYLFGGYLDREVGSQTPRFYIARMVKEMIGDVATYPYQSRKRVGIITSIVLPLICVTLAWLCLTRTG